MTVGIVANMRARLLIKERLIVGEQAFVELIMWEVPNPLPGSTHAFKYRLAYIVNGACVLRYDNESGKGDHRHIGNKEVSYIFSTAQQLLADFWRDVDKWEL